MEPYLTEQTCGLTDDMEYTVKIRATNAIGEGDVSSEVTATPQE